MKKRMRVVLIVLAVILIIANLAMIDYSNFTWADNLPKFLGITGMIVLIISILLQIKQDKKQQTKSAGSSR